MMVFGVVVSLELVMWVLVVFVFVFLLVGVIVQLLFFVFEWVDGYCMWVEYDYWWLLNEQFFFGWLSVVGWEFIVGQMLLCGDGVVYMMCNCVGVVIGLIFWFCDRVMIFKQEKISLWELMCLQYMFYDVDGYFIVDQDDVFYFFGFGFNGVYGMLVI